MNFELANTPPTGNGRTETVARKLTEALLQVAQQPFKKS